MNIDRSGRRLLFLFGLCASFILLFTLALGDDLDIVWGGYLSLLGMSILWYVTRKSRRYYLPVIWTIFFFFGYILAIVEVLLINKVQIPGIDYQLSNEHFMGTACTMTSGMLGLLVAVVIAESIFCRKRQDRKADKLCLSHSSATVEHEDSFHRRLLALWFLGSVFIILVMGVLGIGRTGLHHNIALPFKIAGLLVYTKNMVIPYVGYLLFVLFIGSGNSRYAKRTLVLIAIIGILGSIVFLSRGFIVFMVAPAIFYLVCRGGEKKWVQQLFRRYAPASILFLSLAIPIVMAVRESKYDEQKRSFSELLSDGKSYDVSKGFSEMLSLSVSRIIGLRELQAVNTFSGKELSAPWKIYIGDMEYIEATQEDILGFRSDPDGETAFGVAFGLFGMLYLSGSYLVVFGGVLLLSLMIMVIEEVFRRYFSSSVSLFMAIQFGLWIWGGIDSFLLSRLFLTAIGCFIFTRVLQKRHSIFLVRRENDALVSE